MQAQTRSARSATAAAPAARAAPVLSASLRAKAAAVALPLVGAGAVPVLSSAQLLRSVSRRVACRAAVGAPQEKTTNPMPIVFVSAEVAPYSKTGGLGDVVGGLPIELAKRGHNVISIAPRYDQYWQAWDTSVTVQIDGEEVRFFHALQKGVHRVFVDHPWFLAKVQGLTGEKLYGSKSGADYVDNQKRFALFCKAAIEAVRVLPFGPGEDCVFVANDWHSALIPVLLKDVYQPKGEFTKARAAFCIHNIAFQGRFFEQDYADTGLPFTSIERFKFEDGIPKVFNEKSPAIEGEKIPAVAGKVKKINWLKAGMTAADKLLTVSPNYAAEVSSNEARGVELDGVVRAVGGIEGIVNGMDVEEWSPLKDKFLPVNYDKTTVFAGKAAAKAALQAEAGLPVDPEVPLFGFIGRLEEQKGVDILLKALPALKAANVQVVILGTGKAKLEAAVKALDTTLPGVAKGVVKFSAPMAHLITAGADFMMVPSRFEPCGLIQLHAMQYGTVPLVSSTGGLVDTVKEGVTGFHMGEMNADSLTEADGAAVASTMARAAQVFATPAYKEMVKACVAQDLSWAKPARKWEAVLENMRYGNNDAGEKKASVATPVKAVVA